MRENFGNSWLLTKFALRRERVVSGVWVVSIAVVILALVPGLDAIMGAEAQASLIPALENPALISMVGPAYAALHPHYGALYSNFMLLFTALTVGIMNIFLVTRLTRADEEKGRYEVIRSLPVGRLSNLTAAVVTAVIVNIALGVIIGFGMFLFGMGIDDGSICFNGSLLWGASLAVTGLVFAGIAALFSQLSSSSRGAIAYSFVVLMFFYLLRAPGDMNADMEILSLISPLGLVLRAQTFNYNNWLPVFILLGISVVVTAAAYYFNAMRDIDQGIIPARAGKAHGGLLMKNSSGLAVKLTKGTLIAWLVGMFILGGSYASVFGELDDFIANNELYQQLILSPAGIDIEEFNELPIEERVAKMHYLVNQAGHTVTDLFTSMITVMMAMVTIAPVAMLILRVKSEEREARSEILLATSLCKIKYIASYAVIAFVAAVLIQLALALGLYLVGRAILDDPAQISLPFMLRANLVYVPALWVKAGVTVLLVGLIPKAAGAIWAYFGFTFFVVFFGRMIPQLDMLAWFTPFGYVPQLPMDEARVLPMVGLTVVAACLTVLGFFFYRKRDINAVIN